MASELVYKKVTKIVTHDASDLLYMDVNETLKHYFFMIIMFDLFPQIFS